jgi:hypothetical protein
VNGILKDITRNWETNRTLNLKCIYPEN